MKITLSGVEVELTDEEGQTRLTAGGVNYGLYSHELRALRVAIGVVALRVTREREQEKRRKIAVAS